MTLGLTREKKERGICSDGSEPVKRGCGYSTGYSYKATYVFTYFGPIDCWVETIAPANCTLPAQFFLLVCTCTYMYVHVCTCTCTALHCHCLFGPWFAVDAIVNVLDMLLFIVMQVIR